MTHAHIHQIKGSTSSQSMMHTYNSIITDPATGLAEKARAYETKGDICHASGDSDQARYCYTMATYADPLYEVPYRKRIALVDPVALPKRTVSVVISSYYSFTKLVQTVDTVRRNTFFPHELIVIVDKCDDGTVEYVRDNDGKNNFVGIVNERHKGNVGSLITGLCQTRGHYIALIADDIHVMPGWDLEIIAAIDGDPQTGCGIPLIVDSDGKVDSAGQHNQFLSTKYDWVGRLYANNADEVLGKNILAYPDYHQSRECDYGYVPVLKRACIEQVGTVDGSYRHYFFDPDLGYTLQKHGWKNTFVPTSILMHGNHWGAQNVEGLKQKAAPEYYYFVHKWGLYLP